MFFVLVAWLGGGARLLTTSYFISSLLLKICYKVDTCLKIMGGAGT